MWPYILFVAVFFLVLTPISFLVLGSFSTASLPTDFSLATMGWVNYIKVYTDPHTYSLLTNTVIYVGGGALRWPSPWQPYWPGWWSAPMFH